MNCDCELRNRKWNPNTGRCESCDKYYPSKMESTETRPGHGSRNDPNYRFNSLEHAVWVNSSGHGRKIMIQWLISRRYFIIKNPKGETIIDGYGKFSKALDEIGPTLPEICGEHYDPLKED